MRQKKHLFLAIILLFVSSFSWAQPWLPVEGKIVNSSTLRLFLVKIEGDYQWLAQPKTMIRPHGGKTSFAAIVNYNPDTDPEVVLWYSDRPPGHKPGNLCAVTVEYFGSANQPQFTGGVDCGTSPDIAGYTTSACSGSGVNNCNVEFVDS